MVKDSVLLRNIGSSSSIVFDVNLSSGGISLESSYNFGVFCLSLGAEDIILAIIAMLRSK